MNKLDNLFNQIETKASPRYHWRHYQ